MKEKGIYQILVQTPEKHEEKKERGGERSIFLGRWRSDHSSNGGHEWERGGKKRGVEGFLRSDGEGFCVVAGEEEKVTGWPFLFLCYQKEVLLSFFSHISFSFFFSFF